MLSTPRVEEVIMKYITLVLLTSLSSLNLFENTFFSKYSPFIHVGERTRRRRGTGELQMLHIEKDIFHWIWQKWVLSKAIKLKNCTEKKSPTTYPWMSEINFFRRESSTESFKLFYYVSHCFSSFFIIFYQLHFQPVKA